MDNRPTEKHKKFLEFMHQASLEFMEVLGLTLDETVALIAIFSALSQKSYEGTPDAER